MKLLGPVVSSPHQVMGEERPRWKQRYSAAGVHLFDRITGLNILIDEVTVPASLYSRAPRHVSIALSNRCDLACPHCYAPKSSDQLSFTAIMRWLAELDAHGTLGVGFGGGEPTLYPHFVRLCQQVAQRTGLAVSFTTHGYHIDSDMADGLRGSIHFIRVSMDGVWTTYESIRGRPFSRLLTRLEQIRTISPFGINVVVNERTLPDLDDVARIAADVGACELLLLPQVAVRRVPGIASHALQDLRRWVESYKGPLRLSINEASADGFPICDPLVEERGLRAYAHIDAMGVVKPSSYHDSGVPIGEGGVLEALNQLASNLGEISV